MTLFVHGFGKYLSSSDFYDVVLIDPQRPGQEYRCHKIILANSSRYFEEALIRPPEVALPTGLPTAAPGEGANKEDAVEEVEIPAEEASPERFELKCPDPDLLFPSVLRYMYEGVAEVTAENCVALLALADHYTLIDLKDMVSEYISGNITRDNATIMLQKAVEFNANDIIKKCISVVARFFHSMPLSEVDSVLLRVDVVVDLFQHPRLAVKTEGDVFDAVCRYVNRYQNALSDDDVYEVFSTVRFPFMTANGLERAARNRHVPQDLLIEGLVVRLKKAEAESEKKKKKIKRHKQEREAAERKRSPREDEEDPKDREKRMRRESKDTKSSKETKGTKDKKEDKKKDKKDKKDKEEKEKEKEKKPPSGKMLGPKSKTKVVVRPMSRGASLGDLNLRLLPRSAYGKHFEYSPSQAEPRGLFWHIATNGGTNAFRNPAIPVHGIGYIKVSASSIQKGSPLLVVGREMVEFWTQDVPSSWFQVDLGSHRTVIPNYYSLRHGGNYKADSLRNWDLQGSDDGTDWVTLSRHQDDTSLAENFAMAAWPVQCNRSYRFLRILQTGRNSSNHNFLCLSGLEVFGELFTDKSSDDDSDDDW